MAKKQEIDINTIPNKLILTNRDETIFSFYFEDNILKEINTAGNKRGFLNNIYIGKVQNIVLNIQAAFVELENKVMGYLPLEELKNPIILNREYDGRLVAGDEILVQVMKEAVKTKEAVLSTNLTFAGVYTVVSTGDPQIGFSHNISKEQKRFLNSLLDTQDLKGCGLILRTNAMDIDEDNSHLLLEELKNLLECKENVLKKAQSRTVFSLLYQEAPFFVKEVRDIYLNKVEKIITDCRIVYKELNQIDFEQNEELRERLYLYQDNQVSLWALHGLSAKLEEALAKKVWLKSGGYLVIEPTEALTVVDVNTGKSLSKRKKEEHIFLTNREAAIETVRQLRLRNLSGIIIVDFISMKDKSNEEKILRILHSLLSEDPTKSILVDITPLGLVEITRKKVTETLAEKLKKPT